MTSHQMTAVAVKTRIEQLSADVGKRNVLIEDILLGYSLSREAIMLHLVEYEAMYALIAKHSALWDDYDVPDVKKEMTGFLDELATLIK